MLAAWRSSRSAPTTLPSLAAFATLRNEVNAVDAPWERPTTPARLAGRLRFGWDGEPEDPYLATADGVPVAYGTVSTSEYDNLDLAFVMVAVHPSYRRRGHGTALLTALLEEARRRGRTSVVGETWESEALHAFATHHGFERKARLHQPPADARRRGLARPRRAVRRGVGRRARLRPRALGNADPRGPPGRPRGDGLRHQRRAPGRPRLRGRGVHGRAHAGLRGGLRRQGGADVPGGGPARPDRRARRPDRGGRRHRGAHLGRPARHVGDPGAPGPPAGAAAQGRVCCSGCVRPSRRC
ncbi:GNAT family N-acetyltransferase [Nocardioides sp. W3-2-3]|uniref:GNAT family N-acetyltransferase n=1 Tax=Nocardioides convexus TaxID=2712224 RepID=UPI0024187E85|nr:GNAT family N-acetyltransferase [Nocardioides convexus]NGZ99736.1 GNAT family N-acetyltransferase [Nocardioides convexus]